MFVRAVFIASGSYSGSASTTMEDMYPENDDAVISDCQGSWSLSYNFYRLQLNDGGLSDRIYGSVEGSVAEYFFGPADSGFGVDEHDTLEPFGSITFTASGSSTIRYPDGSSFNGGGAFTLHSKRASVSIFLRGQPDGQIQTEVNISARFGFSVPDGSDPGGDGLGYSIVLGIHEVRNGFATVSTVCTSNVIPTGDVVANNSTSVGASYTNNVYDDQEFESSVSGSSNLFAYHQPSGTLSDVTNHLLAGPCSRALALSASLASATVGGDPDGIATIAGRLSQTQVVKCDPYPSQWVGGGLMTYPPYGGGQALQKVVKLTLRVTAIGPVASLGSLLVEEGLTLRVTISGATGGTFRIGYIIDNGNVSGVSAPIPRNASAAQFQSIMAAHPLLPAGSFVRVVSAANGGPWTVSIYASNVTPYTPFYADSALTPANTGNVYLEGPDWGGGMIRALALRGPPSACPERGGVTIIRIPGLSGQYPGHDETVTLTSTGRLAGDPSYYCDCGGNCPSAPSAMLLRLTSDEVEDSPAVDESVVISRTSSTPCVYAASWTASSGTNAGNAMVAAINVDNNGFYRLDVYDDESSLIAVAFGSCEEGKSLPGIAWRLDSVAGVWSNYEGLAITTT